MRIDLVVGAVGLIATLVGVFLAWGPWREHWHRRRRDDVTVLKELAQAIIKNYKGASAARYLYAEVKGAKATYPKPSEEPGTAMGSSCSRLRSRQDCSSVPSNNNRMQGPDFRNPRSRARSRC
jgi:hypothetical protein